MEEDLFYDEYIPLPSTSYENFQNDDDEILMLDEVHTSKISERNSGNDEDVNNIRIEGIPATGGSNDPMKRFSFGLSRRSFSQPVLPTTPKFREKTHLPILDDSTSVPTRVSSTQQPHGEAPARKKGTRKPQSVLDEFFGVYCLISRSTLKHYKNRCYIGYTVDPNRRVKQHNGGREAGGAKKTDNRGPWDMVCIVHGFPCNVAALRFEWAWQNPEKSRTLKGKGLEKKGRKETPFMYRLRIACHLMNTDPWRKLALTFRWLMPSAEIPFPSDCPPPKHVETKYGLVEKTTTVIPDARESTVITGSCKICSKLIAKLEDFVRCPNCVSHFHITCLAKNGLGSNYASTLFPTEASCSKCRKKYLWGDVIRDQRMILKIDGAQKDEDLKGRVPLKEII